MPRIYYTASGYLGNFQNLNTNIEQHILCRKLDLYRAIITVGNPSFITLNDIRKFGLWPALSASIIQKVLLVQTNISSNVGGIHLNPIYETYVTDQKRIVSYNLGMAVAKIYAERLLNIPNLTHVESLKKVNAITFVNPAIKKEPDLVGKTDNGDWHVFEAKGTSKNSLTKPIADAKYQAQQVNLIHGNAPATLTACATSFRQNKIFTKLVDPPGNGPKAIEIDETKFYDQYYAPFFALRDVSNSSFKLKKVDDLEYNSIDLKTPKLNLTLGLEREVYELLQEKNFSSVNEFYRRKKNFEPNFQLENQVSVGLDGFIVKYLNH